MVLGRLKNLVGTTEQPQPKVVQTEESLPEIWELVISDMIQRNEVGKKKYKTPLHPFNGRDALVDAYQEALDLAVYLRQRIYEERGE